MKPTELSILIPTRNRPDILARTLSELQARGFSEHPLLVYDDVSDDPEAIASVVAKWEGARLIRGKKRGGQVVGRNRLLELAESHFALMLDDDSWPEKRDDLINAVESMKKDDIDVATFQCRSLANGHFSIPEGQLRRQVFSFLGGASVVKVSKIRSLKGYRETFIYGYEEPELAFRLWLANARIEQFPDVVFAHNHFETPNENRDHAEYHRLYARNSILMSSLNMPLVFGLAHGMLRSIRRSFYAKGYAGAKIRGTWQGLVDSFRLWPERKPCTWSQALRWIQINRR